MNQQRLGVIRGVAGVLWASLAVTCQADGAAAGQWYFDVFELLMAGKAEEAAAKFEEGVTGLRTPGKPPPADRTEDTADGYAVKDCDVCPELVVVPAGAFDMGSPPVETGRDSNEGPPHRVQVPAFALGRTEVTFAQYDAYAAVTGARKPDDEGWGRGARPVINVSWNDAQAYVQWLRQRTGKAYRLPSEAEWEYAARAGTQTPFATGPCITTAQANYDGNYHPWCGAKEIWLGKTQPVGRYPANPWGLDDMAGNVWEWVEDCYHDSYAGAPADGSAWRTGDCHWRVSRGGSWNFSPRRARSAGRHWNAVSIRDYDLGFRVARTLP
jgi:formylglycine-generating enzyme required for sulfatase activity